MAVRRQRRHRLPLAPPPGLADPAPPPGRAQVELLLELAGLVAAGQFLLKVVFAEDREKTLTEIK